MIAARYNLSVPRRPKEPLQPFIIKLRHGINLIVPGDASVASLVPFLAHAMEYFEKQRDVEKIQIYKGVPYAGRALRRGRNLGRCELSPTTPTTIAGVKTTILHPEHAKPVAVWLEAVINAFSLAHGLEDLIEQRAVAQKQAPPDEWLFEVLDRPQGQLLALQKLIEESQRRAGQITEKD